MNSRPFWLKRIENAWREAPIAWLCGVRRSGKTTLAECLGPERTLYLNCDLPTVEDFVLAHRRDEVDAIECKWDPGAFDPAALRLFRRYYPNGRNYLVTPSGDPAYDKRYGNLDVRVCTPTGIRGDVSSER
jgi:hypothetical protein